jgi:hypothetical protein
MDIPLQGAEVLREKARCGQTKHQKYGTYLTVLKEKPEILVYLIEHIDKSPNGEILVKAVDMAPAMGPSFEKLGETSIGWGLKFALFTHGIFLSTTESKEINPKTNKGYMLLRLRRAKAGDVLSEGLAKYLEPAGEDDPDNPVEQCGTPTYLL